ncbi:MAG: methyltransferase domain-containing protein [Burkholderiaceae bacterium]|nr:methyltransferase domain-containing protein [Burkholderiaceae bacterium]
MPVCVICEQSVERWMPDPEREAYSPALRSLDIVAADADRHGCPTCGADDRERHAWMYLAATGILDEVAGRRALHVGPEPRLQQRLARLPIEWTLAQIDELETTLAASEAGGFHLIVCNRVLSAVPDVGETVRALGQQLSDGGWLMAQSPYAPTLKHTLAFTAKPRPEAAHLFFGDRGHVRLFGADFACPFASAGLHGGAYRHEDVLPGMDAATWGCNPREPLFLFSRTRCLRSPS